VNDPTPASVAEPAARHIYLIDKPGAPQSQVRMGWIGVARNTPDYYTLDVLNTLLGGTFTSRLNMNLREAHGYTYGAGSRFDMRKTPGPFYATAAVQTDKTVESLREFFKELDAIHDPVPADDLSRIRNLEALGFPGSFETTADMASQLSVLEVYHLPDSFFGDYVPMIEKVTAADLQRVAKQDIQSDHFAVIVVGDLSKIEKPIRDANLAPVEILKAEDLLK
jgi:zinc protease